MHLKSVVSGAVMLMASLAVQAEPVRAEEKVDLTIASFRAGSSWFVYAAAIGDLLRDVLPAGSSVDAPPMGGGKSNVLLVSAGKAQLALSHGMTNQWATSGSVAYDAPIENVRAIAGGLDTYYLAVIATEAQENLELESYFAATNPDAVIGFNPPGSVATFSGKLILSEIGAGEDQVEGQGGRYLSLPPPETTAGFAEGSVEVTTQMITAGHPMTTQITNSSDADILQVSEETLSAMESKYGFGRSELPAGSFTGQDNSVVLPSTSSTLIVNEDMSDDLAYLITKTVVEGSEALAIAHKALADFNPADAWRAENLNLPLHPGAARYYRERGWLK